MVITDGKKVAYENFRGGKGKIYITWFVEEKPYKDSAVQKIALVEVPPGSSVGFHIHKDTEEIYYILKGKGKYRDGDNELIVERGITITPVGTGHSIENIGEDMLRLLAVINGPIFPGV